MTASPPVASQRSARVLRARMWVPRTLHEVWPFFADAHNLEALTPPFLRFHVATPAPIAMHVDARIDYRLRVHGVPLGWRTRIARWEPPYCFADEQERGPYKRWYHTHTFEPLDGGTVIGDHVEFVVRGGPIAPLLLRWLVEPDVLAIFRFRAQRIAERFGGDAREAKVSIETPSRSTAAPPQPR